MKNFLFVCLLFPAFLSNAQEVSVTLSKEFEFRDEGNTYKIDNFYYRDEIEAGPMQFAFTAKLKKNGHGITLYKYDETMKEVKKVALEDGKKVFGPLPSQFVVFDGKLVLFFYKYQEDENVKLYMAEIDRETLLIKTPKEIYTYYQKNVGLLQMKKLEAALTNKLMYAFSPDKTKMLVATNGGSDDIVTLMIDKNLDTSNVLTSKYPVGKTITFTSIFLDQNDNKYLAYKHSYQKGVFIQNNKGKDVYADLKMVQPDLYPEDIQFRNSKDNSKVYLYANYRAKYLSEGIFLATADATNLKLNKEILLPYPDDLKEKMYKMEFGDRSKSNYSVRGISFELTEMDNGTIALAGSPSYTTSFQASNGASYSSGYTGPIVAAFIKNGKARFIIVPRSIRLSGGSGCIITGYKNNLVCIYNDYKKNIENDVLSDKVYSSTTLNFMILVSTTINSDGEILSRKKISDNAVGKNYFNTSYNQKLAENKYLIPIGRERVNMVKYYSEVVQWGLIAIQ